MKKITQFTIDCMRRFGIRTRLLLLLIIFTVLPTQIISNISANKMTDLFIEAKNSYWNVSQQIIRNNLSNMIKQIDFYAFNILDNHSIFNHLNSRSPLYENRHEYIEQALSEVVDSNSPVSKIAIITPENEQFNSDKKNSNLDIAMFSEVDTLPIIMQIPTISLDSVNNVQVRTLIEFSTGIKYGYLCIFIDNNAIFDCYNNILSADDTCMIVNSKQQVIFSDTHHNSGGLLSLSLPDFTENDEYITESLIQDNAYYSKKIKIDSTPTLDWYLVCAFSNKDLRFQIKNLNRFIITLQIILLLISVFIIIKLSNRLTIYVRQLYLKMSEYPNKDSFTPTLSAPPQDEFAFLEKTLHDMIIRINELMQNIEINQKKQRELEFQIMQAQINPHFIYNSLDSISCIAQKNGQYEVRKIAIALTNFFRISLSKGDKYISVHEELQHVKYYVTIEQFRANNSFNVTYDIAPDILEKKIIKIILQPLVENAIKHGLKNKSGIGHIRISGFMLDNKLHFEVSDDGCGFDTTMLNDTSSYHGFGYKNVNNRIKLEYGDEYGLSYYSIPGKMTRAEVIIGYND